MHLSRRGIPWLSDGVRRYRRILCLFACLGVIAWTLLFATHLHDHEAESRSHAPVCALCLAMPAAAPPPAQLLVAAPQCATGPAAVAADLPQPASGAPSAYLSRGPPRA